VNEPVAPENVCTVCSWQFAGQWCSTSAHVSAEPVSVPCCGSVAEPEKLITLPACHVVELVGVVIVAVGRVLPAVIVMPAVAVAPCGSVTRSFTLYVPAVEYVRDGATCVESPNVPLPSRSQL
jgi:hypothetical protein